MLVDISMPLVAGSIFRLGTPPVAIAKRWFYHASEAVSYTHLRAHET